MKLATLHNGKRDGQLVVVSRDLATAVPARGVAPSLIHALENWTRVKGALETLYQELNAKRIDEARPFDVQQCLAPLPRAPYRIDIVPAPAGTQQPVDGGASQIPRLQQGISDAYTSGIENIMLPADVSGICFEARLSAAVDDVPMSTSHRDAIRHVRLLMLTSELSAVAHGAQAPSTCRTHRACISISCAPIAITPDEFVGPLHLDGVRFPLALRVNGEPMPMQSQDETLSNFPPWIVQASRWRALSAGTLVGAKRVVHLNQARSMTLNARNAPSDAFHAQADVAKHGARIHVEMMDAQNRTIFGAIQHRLVGETEDSLHR